MQPQPPGGFYPGAPGAPRPPGGQAPPTQQFQGMNLGGFQQPPPGAPQQFPMTNGPPGPGFRPPTMGGPGMAGTPGQPFGGPPTGAGPPGGPFPPPGQPFGQPAMGAPPPGAPPPGGPWGQQPGSFPMSGGPPRGPIPPPGALPKPPGGPVGPIPPPGGPIPPHGGMPPPGGAMQPPPGGIPPPGGFMPPARPGFPPPPGAGFPPPAMPTAPGGMRPPGPSGPQGAGDGYNVVGANIPNGVPGGYQAPPFGPPLGRAGSMSSGQAPPITGPPGRPAAPPQRIDPTQIPRPELTGPKQTIVFETRVNGAHNPPPGALTQFVVRDFGSCSPRFMRSSLNSVPHTQDLLQMTGMPLALVVQPLALPHADDDPIQVVDFGEMGPVRCSNCKAYMNPYMRFVNNGRTFVCNFCNKSNETPESYFAYMGPDGRRQDANDRPELCKGTVEIVATRDYLVRPPMPPVHFFLIDVTATAIATGATGAVCAAILQCLDSIQGGDRALVGFATFDSSIQFYSMRPDLPQASMLVVSDIEEIYAPLSMPLLAPLAECRGAIEALLNSIPNMFAGSKIGSSCAGAAIEAAIEAVKFAGGKVHAFITSLPSLGVHALKLRQSSTPGDKADKEKLAVLQSQDNTFKSSAMRAADYQICIDLFFLTDSYVDVASLSDLTHTTGGSIYHYCPWSLMDADQLLNDLQWNVARPQGLEAVMRVRCSTGLEVEGYFGSFHRPNLTDVQLPALDCDKAIITKLSHSEKLTPGSEVYVQCALLYTTTDGHRRIRLHTLALPVSDVIGNVFKGADLDAQITWMARKAAANLPGGTLAAAREAVSSHTVTLLHAYRKYCVTSSSAVQLVLPEALKLLPLYALSLQKSAGLRADARLDERALWMVAAMNLPVTRVVPMLYPRMIAFHRLLDQLQGGKLESPPEGITLSAEMLEQGGVYLLENGIDAMLFFDKAVSRQLLYELTGFNTWEEMTAGTSPLGLAPRDTPAGRVMSDLLAKVRLQRAAYMRLRVMRKGDNSEALFYSSLIEDRSAGTKSYVEYLCEVHKLIQQKFQ